MTLAGGRAGAFSATSATTVNASGTLDLGGVGQTINAVTLAGGKLTNGSLTGAVTSTGGAINGLGGTASVTANSGTTTLSGTNTYSGTTVVGDATHSATLLGGAANAFSASSTTVNASATLDLGGFGQTINAVILAGGKLTNGSLTGAVTSTGGTIDGLGGTASVTVNSGTTTATGNNSYSGVTNLNGGTLTAGSVVNAFGTGILNLNGGTLTSSSSGTATLGNSSTNIGAGGATIGGSNNLTITNGGVFSGVLTVTSTATTSLNGAFAGVGGVTMNSSGGTLGLFGANTYVGVTTLTAGTLIVGNAVNALGTGILNLNGGTMRSSSGTATLGNSSTNVGAGGATIGGSNNLTITNGGALFGLLTVISTGTTTLSGAFSGAGGVTMNGTGGTLAFKGVNTYSGATTVIDGTLEVGNGGSITQSVSLTNSANVVVDGGGSATFGSVTNNATGTITVAAGGTVHDDLNNAGTVTNNGTYVANVAGNTGSIVNNSLWTGNVASNAGTVVNNLTWNGTIATSGNFTNAAAATVTGLVTNSGTGINAGTLSGGLTNTAGTFNNGGTISGITTVSGGTLFGIGSTGALNVASGAAFAPGNGTPGTSATVNGSLAFQSGAFYLVGLNPQTASFANVTGTASLASASVLALFSSGTYVAKQYTILNASGGFGGSSFGSLVNTNLPSGFKTSLSYDATHAYLDLVLSFIPPAGGSLGVNQQGVGGAVVSYFNRNGSIPLAFGGLTATTLTQASGETATGSQQTTFNAMTQFMGVMTDPFTAGRGEAPAGPTAYADQHDADAMFAKATSATAFTERWNVWAAGFGGSQKTDGNALAGSNRDTSSIFGTAVGADYWLTPQTIAGFALAGGGTNFAVANGGAGRSDLFQAGAFIRHTAGSAYITAALAYGWQDITTDRTVTIAGIDRLRAQFNANAWSGRIEGGNRMALGGFGLTPYAAAQATAFQLPFYAESVASGANTFALAYNGKTVTATRSELGLRSDTSIAIADAILTLRGRAAWGHDFNPDRAVGATFQALPGASFVVNGARQAGNSALATASGEMKWLNGWSTAATFEGEFSSVTRSYAGKGVVRYAW